MAFELGKTAFTFSSKQGFDKFLEQMAQQGHKFSFYDWPKSVSWWQYLWLDFEGKLKRMTPTSFELSKHRLNVIDITG